MKTNNATNPEILFFKRSSCMVSMKLDYNIEDTHKQYRLFEMSVIYWNECTL